MMSELTTIIIACSAAFFAGFIDSIAGGGGLIQLPALLLLGLPPSLALGTNKIVSFCGTAIATIRYSISIVMPWRLILLSLPIALAFSYIGARLILITDSEATRKIIIILLPIAFILMMILSKKKKPPLSEPKPMGFLISTGICGLYDGYLGPGVGTFLATSYNRWSKLNYLHATASAKPVNLTTNLGALIAFLAADQVRFDIALPMIAFSMLGSLLGSSGAIHFGETFVKSMLIVSFALLAGINLWKAFF